VSVSVLKIDPEHAIKLPEPKFETA